SFSEQPRDFDGLTATLLILFSPGRHSRAVLASLPSLSKYQIVQTRPPWLPRDDQTRDLRSISHKGSPAGLPRGSRCLTHPLCDIPSWRFHPLLRQSLSPVLILLDWPLATEACRGDFVRALL